MTLPARLPLTKPRRAGYVLLASLAWAACAGSPADEVDGAVTPMDLGGALVDSAAPIDAALPVCGSPTTPAGFHVSPTGSPSGDGSMAAPWDLVTALAQPPSVKPGDTIWLHGGTYTSPATVKSALTGQAGAEIVVRSYPNEWAILDGSGAPTAYVLEIGGAFTIYRDFEVTNTWATSRDTATGRGEGIQLVAPNAKLVNLVIHDTGQGVGSWEAAVDSEIYGCLIYNNGTDDGGGKASGHGIYMNSFSGTKKVHDNLIFNGYSFGLHAYTTNGKLDGIEVAGNIWWNTGIAAIGSSTDDLKDNCLIGGLQPASRITVADNLGWARTLGERDVRFGYSASNQDITLTGNYFVGDTWFDAPWQSITMSGNTFNGTMTGIDPAAYPGNTYVASSPTANEVFVRPNRYAPGRGHVVVYNWEQKDTVDADVASVLPIGTPYEVRNAQDYFGPPVLSGTFDGQPLHLPMANLHPVQPIGSPTAIKPTEETGKAFNVFVIVPTCP